MKLPIKFRYLLPLALIYAAPYSSAHPIDESEAAKATIEDKTIKSKVFGDITLPSDSELTELKENLPDMNGIAHDMIHLAKDKKFRSGMERSMKIFMDRIDVENMEKDDHGIPDLNGLLGDMISLLGDEEFVGGMVETIDPLAEIMQKHMPDGKEPKPRKHRH